ncbi:RNase P subunit p30 family protein [Natrialbaceae archaeon A-gly3]
MYEGVHARPDGESTVARMAKTAADYGFSGVVVRNHSDSRVDVDAEAISEAYGIDVVSGLEVRAESPQEAGGSIGNYRGSYTIVAVHGGTTALNRFAVENEKVDVLAHPMAGEGDFNHVLAKEAAKNGVRIEFSLSSVLRASGGRRVRAIASLRKLRELVEYYDAPYVVSADPGNHLEIRAPRELLALGEEIGFSRDDLEDGFEEWGRLAERNRHVHSESFIEPGVERGRYEKEP